MMTSVKIMVVTSLVLILGGAMAQNGDTSVGDVPSSEARTTSESAMWRLGSALSEDVQAVPTPTLVEHFRDLRLVLEATGGDALQVIAVAIEPVEQALVAEPFDQATLVTALQELALTMRTAAGPGDAPLTIELASLVDAAAARIEDEGYTPRMEVDVP